MKKNDQEILKYRAGMISGAKKEPGLPGKSLPVVEFILGSEKYAIGNSFVTEVLSYRTITKIPGTPDFIAGLINLRGKVYSIVNLKVLFHKEEYEISPKDKIMLLQNGQMEFGITVDAVKEMKQVDTGTLSAPPATISRVGARYIAGICPDRTILLDVVSILTDETIIINQK